MSRCRTLLLTLATMTSVGLVTPRILADPISYNITALGQGLPIGINNQGQVGLGATFGYQGSWSYDGYTMGAGTFEYIPTASIYNSLGPTAGTVSTPNASGPIPGGGNGTTVPWVNDAGTSTGVTTNMNNQLIAYVNVGGVQQQFGPFGNNGDNWTDPRAINNAGQVVGDAWFPNMSGPHAFLYSGGVTQDLGTLGGTSSMATAISSSGVVVGWSLAPSLQPNESGTWHAFMYQNGTMTDLNPMLGSYESQALGINSSGVIVGQMQFGYFDNPWHAFILDNGKVTDLNSLLPSGSPWTLVAATGINDLGQIIGVGNDNGVAATFLLTPSSLGDPPDLPVPEPTSLIVFAGIVSAVIARRTVAARGTLRV